MKSYGFGDSSEHVKHGEFDWAGIKTKRDAYITRLNGIYARNLAKEGVDYLFGFAKFANADADVEVKLTGDQKLDFLEGKQFSKDETLVFSADKILIATGGQAVIPPKVEGAELGLNSDGFFDLETQPESVAVVGAGYIGVEFSGVFQSLGSKTHLVIRGDTVLRSFDEIIQDTITNFYTDKLGVDVIKQSGSVTKIEKLSLGKKAVFLGNVTTLEVDEVIWTVGRKATIDIAVEKVVVKLDDKLQPIVDDYQQTSNS